MSTTTTKPPYMGEALQEIVYCIHKYGSYSTHDRARIILLCGCFEELKAVMALFSTEDEDGEVNDAGLKYISCLMDSPIPQLDRLLRWPWDAEYEHES